MARLLEELSPGTPVVDRSGEPVGEVRGIYGLGQARAAEYVLVHWDARGVEALIPSTEVASLNDAVQLLGSASSYDTLPAFDPSANPSLHAL